MAAQKHRTLNLQFNYFSTFSRNFDLQSSDFKGHLRNFNERGRYATYR